LPAICSGKPPALANQQLQTQDTKAHFDRLSTRWSCNYDSRSGAMRQRIADFSTALAGLPAGARLLDFGCGSGDITRALAAKGHAMTGIDLSPAMIATARQLSGADKIDWAVAKVGVTLPFPDGVFDGALASSVLEYHPDPAAQLVEIARVLKSGGVFAFTVPEMSHSLRVSEEKWRRLATSFLWPLLRLTPRHDYFEYLRVSINRWPLDRWLALAHNAGFAVLSPIARNSALTLVLTQKV
jgi:ubiquinone/menaquinone biosynthesis C-methylase UbiE